VITASDRAARSITAAFHRARRAEGLAAWPAPNIKDWKTFVRAEWEQRTFDGHLVLNPTQEQALWAAIAGGDNHLATLLEGPRRRLATLAMDAHGLLCSYTPRFLRSTARTAWERDAAVFSGWLNAFDDTCRAKNLLSPSRLPLELIPLLASDPAARPPLLLAGFDRILPAQHAVFEAWGSWREASAAAPASQLHFHEAPDAQAELAACALWCRHQIAANPQARLLVVTQDVQRRRGEIERAFLKHASPITPAHQLFEFSLGIPLSQVALASGAHLLLRWLTAPLAEQELDWLFSTGQAAASSQESSALQAFIRALRRRGLERTHWLLADFIAQRSSSKPLPPAWIDRITAAQFQLSSYTRQPRSPVDWAELVPKLLETANWAVARPLVSAEFQALHRWQQALEAAGSLGFDGRRITWQEFLSELRLTLDETLFAPESTGAPIQIAGPAESAGLTADALWFLGADEDAWPAAGSMHPLLPPEVQREAAMPHATPQLDLQLAQAMTHRLLAAAPEVHFSYPRQNQAAEARPSSLIVRLIGPPQPLLPELKAAPTLPPLTELFADASRIPLSSNQAAGGSSVLSFQSQCPFKAFAATRLAAQTWEPAQAALTPSQRGQLLHAVLHSIWAGPPQGIRTHTELQNLTDLRAFVATHVSRVMAQELSAGIRQQMPRRYLILEEMRLTGLITQWLDYEAARVPFAVAATEVDTSVHIAGLTLKLRLDRIDRLNDGSLLVIDYKSGDVLPKSWDLPRPEDIQLPLYAGFALQPEEELGGLVFAKVRTANHAFAGRVGDAATTLFTGLKNTNILVKNPFTAEQLIDWRDCIQQLALDYISGRAEVDPREAPKTCQRCGLQTLCRVHETGNLPPSEDCCAGDASTEIADD
jgi:probable DNA repair protein